MGGFSGSKPVFQGIPYNGFFVTGILRVSLKK
jgi:hypothetical protein